jgi:hypothetical protein
MRSQNPILGRKILVAEQQLLIDEAGYERQKSCPMESTTHGKVHDTRAEATYPYFDPTADYVSERFRKFIIEPSLLCLNCRQKSGQPGGWQLLSIGTLASPAR